MMTLAFAHDFNAGGRVFTLDLDLHTRSRRIALFGPSGAGKSLSAAVLAGLVRPREGCIVVEGTTFLDTHNRVFLSPQQRRIGFLAQNYALFPHLTIAQNIAFGLKSGCFNPSRAARLPAIANHWVQTLGLEGVLHHYPAQVSGGQRQRAALARALVLRPRMLILDEPLAALDIPLRQQVREALAQLQQELALPSLLITHDPQDAAVLADEVFCLDNGRIERVSMPRDLLNFPGAVA